MALALSGGAFAEAPEIEEPPPPVLQKLFGDELVDAKGAKTAITDVGSKKIAIYFSAHWCPPCRMFTPRLVKAYREMKEAGADVEVIFVSSDRSKKAMRDYMKDARMPWLAVPYNSKKRDELGKRFGVRGIPMLIVVDSSGNLLSANGRFDVMSHGAKAYDHW